MNPGQYQVNCVLLLEEDQAFLASSPSDSLATLIHFVSGVTFKANNLSSGLRDNTMMYINICVQPTQKRLVTQHTQNMSSNSTIVHEFRDLMTDVGGRRCVLRKNIFPKGWTKNPPKQVCLADKTLISLPRVFCPILDPSNAHTRQTPKITENGLKATIQYIS